MEKKPQPITLTSDALAVVEDDADICLSPESMEIIRQTAEEEGVSLERAALILLTSQEEG